MVTLALTNKRAAAAAAAQELKILEDAAMDVGILPPTTSAAAQPTPTSAQGTEQTSHPTAAKPQLHLTAQEPALYPQAPPAARAAVVFTHATAEQKPGQHQSLTGKQPDQHTLNAAAEPQLQTAAQDTGQPPAAAPAKDSLDLLRSGGSTKASTSTRFC